MNNELLKIFKRILKIKKKINNPSQTNSKNWDSIAHLNIIFAIEEKFKIKFNEKEMMNITSFNEAKKIISKKKKYD